MILLHWTSIPTCNPGHKITMYSLDSDIIVGSCSPFLSHEHYLLSHLLPCCLVLTVTCNLPLLLICYTKFYAANLILLSKHSQLQETPICLHPHI